MKRTTLAKIGVAVAIRYRRVLARIAAKMARHPRRTWHVAKGGKTAISTVQSIRATPEAQQRSKLGAKAVSRAAKRTTKIGLQDAASDAAVLADLLQAFSELAAAIHAIRAEQPKRHRLSKIGARLLIAGGAIYFGYRVLKHQHADVAE